MWRVTTITMAALLCVSCGGGIDSYADAIEAQAEVMEEMTPYFHDLYGNPSSMHSFVPS